MDDGPEAAGPGGFMVYVAVVFIAILILLTVFLNTSGQGTTAATAITENTWSLQSFTDTKGNTVPVLNGTTITAKFSTDGKLTGSGGCNQYSGRYMVQSTLMVVSRVTTTSMASCWEDNATLQEERYYAALEDAAALRVHDRFLTLYGIDGKPALIFTPAPTGN
ncbi:MAG: META domain-containing protein [Methanoregula sp.]|jgi:heat shock protein HslJ|uniref:META domain-containing protein n=1 Tax=Methanoregula sp. TaxID=2052170 RepID=UPI003C1F2367